MVNFTNILVPTDFSENSLQALEFAHYLAKQSKAKLHVLHVVEPSPHSENSQNRFSEERFEKSRLLDAEEDLRRFVNKISPQGITIIEALHPGKAYEQVLNYSRKNRIDLIVISSHGWTGLSHLITGNVTNKIMRYSDIPTICIKSNTLVSQKEIPSVKNTFAENWVG